VNEPEPISQETQPPTNETIKKLDLVFACDATGSMGAYIQQAKENIETIISEVVALAQADVRFALIQYRDFTPEYSTFVTQVSPFTESLEEMKGYVNSMSASGGGDGPEAVTEALWEALQLPWRHDSAKVFILISDAPPHGLEPSSDDFPNGDPTGRDPLVLAGLMANKGIVIYSVGVEPGLGSYTHGRDFMMALAKITTGQFLPLANANLLPTVVIGGAIEEISLTRYMELVKEQSDILKASGISDEELKQKLFEYLEEQEGDTFHLQVDDIYGGSYNFDNRDLLVTSASLSELRDSKTLKSDLNTGVLLEDFGSDFTDSIDTEGAEEIKLQSATISTNPMSSEQVNKIYSRYLSQLD
jgi:Mg-chelatase subunit ChlD